MLFEKILGSVSIKNLITILTGSWAKQFPRKSMVHFDCKTLFKLTAAHI